MSLFSSRLLNAAEIVRFPIHKISAAALLAAGMIAASPAAATDAAAVTATASVGAFDAVSNTGLANKADPMFRSLFDGWKKMDAVPHGGIVAVPSQKPVQQFRYTSGFGVRGNPFGGHGGEMHPGLDMAAPTGTPVYATADGIVGRAERTYGGYGNLVQLEHGKGLETRYGHLSQILVHDGQRVHRGDLIALVGSTGRSTGSHLHYEVRIDGRAVNPMPFLQTADYMTALQDRTMPIHAGQAVAMGGPEDPDAAD
ncbi:M23 family metallopeptidase [Sphingomonas abietis]|uniref:M23 family metallopeptidase n=1 Tax=Sphingomonas abietis TaxID=3012344 RepID=A0ABY7NMG2_9SPHN|nr:M23 family metallopeptidase [Sphingomonas abietis]WBO22020.1 M23 family metallopeptidase [Sphingomonas abietis]